MDAFYESLNRLLIIAFRSVLKLEEQTLRKMTPRGLSISEFHLIECVGEGEGGRRTVTELAKQLSLSLPSVTVAVNKLEGKGFLTKARDSKDGRAVYIALTDLGTRVNRLHQHFHELMIHQIADGMSPAEREALLHGISKLNGYFTKKLAEAH
jgi:DNA-binding MarR family transcriptional regulator